MSHLARGLNTIHVIGIGPEDAIGLALREAFENVLFSTDTPSLFVDIRNNETLIGPLTLANRAGCWRCAFERTSAARANSEPATESLWSPDEILKKLTPLLIREIQSINTDGLERSPLIDHVLAIDLSTLDECRNARDCDHVSGLTDAFGAETFVRTRVQEAPNSQGGFAPIVFDEPE